MIRRLAVIPANARLAAGAAVLLALLLASALACRGAGRDASPPVSCIWIVVDTLRADHLEWYGYGRATSPELLPLVARGVQFDNAYTTLPETTPAIASMLTSLHPYRHGVDHLYYRLNRANVTAAELLGRAGYTTAAFVSSFVMIRNFSGLDRGFQVYDDFVDERERYRENYERKAGRTLALAWSWIAQHRQQPFFCLIHLIDPHGPYTPPGEFAHRFRSSTVVPVRGHIPPYQQIPGVHDFNVYQDLYDGEIAYASHELGRFLTALRSSSLFDPTLIVFVADHGEAMGGHGVYFAHGTGLFEDNVHVPMIVKPPAGMRAVRGSRVAQPVSVVDLLPTMLEILGRPVPSFFEGRSLVPLLAGRPGAGGGVFFELHEPQRLAGEVRAGRKTIFDGEHVEQYDLVADPGEVRPLPPERRDAVVAELRRWQLLVTGWQRPFTVEPNFMATERRGTFVHGRRAANPADIAAPADPADIARLRSLGYL